MKTEDNTTAFAPVEESVEPCSEAHIARLQARLAVVDRLMQDAPDADSRKGLAAVKATIRELLEMCEARKRGT